MERPVWTPLGSHPYNTEDKSPPRWFSAVLLVAFIIVGFLHFDAYATTKVPQPFYSGLSSILSGIFVIQFPLFNLKKLRSSPFHIFCLITSVFAIIHGLYQIF